MHAVDISVVGECEFALIQELDAQLIVNHPYLDLMEIKDELGLTQDETSLIWHTINDAHATTMVLMHTPRTIAAAAISLVLTIRPNSGGQSLLSSIRPRSSLQGSTHEAGSKPASKQQKLVTWLAHSGLPLEAIVECTQILISLYAALDKFNEDRCKVQLGALARARGVGDG